MPYRFRRDSHGPSGQESSAEESALELVSEDRLDVPRRACEDGKEMYINTAALTSFTLSGVWMHLPRGTSSWQGLDPCGVVVYTERLAFNSQKRSALVSSLRRPGECGSGGHRGLRGSRCLCQS